MPTTRSAYWHWMKDKAAENIAHVTEWEKPEDEESLKKHVARVLSHGNSHEKAEVLVEAVEFMMACHMIKAHEIQS